MDGGPEFRLVYHASRADSERALLASLDANGLARRSRWMGIGIVVLGLLTLLLNAQVIGTPDQVPWWMWLLSLLIVAAGVLQATLWDRRLRLRRSYKANAVITDVDITERLDDDGARTITPGSETFWRWNQFSSVIEADDLLVLTVGDRRRGAVWSAPRRGLADESDWAELVAFARERVAGPYIRSRR